MDKFKFLKQIDELKEFVPEEKLLKVYSSAENLVGELETEISNLTRNVARLKIKVSNKEEEIFELEQEIGSESKFKLSGIHDNIVTEMAIEKLFENLDRIPIPSLELFINKCTNP